MKECRKISPTNTTKEEAGIAILILDKQSFWVTS